MIYKQYRTIALTLLICTNIIAEDDSQNMDKPLRAVFGLITLGATALLARLVYNSLPQKQSFSLSGNVTATIHQYNNGHICVINDEITINAKSLSQQALAQLPLIKSSKMLEIMDLNSSIEQIKVPGDIAIIYIDDAQKPRIEKDAAFKDLIFTINNGILTVSTPNNEPRKFEYNDQPLCTIYAALQSSKLTASHHAHVTIVNQKLNSITSTNFAHISGSIQTNKDLELDCSDHSKLQLNNIKTENLTVKSSNFSQVNITGTVNHHQKITVTDHAQYTGTIQGFLKKIRLFAKDFASLDLNQIHGETLEVTASDHSQMNLSGTVQHQALDASDFCSIDASNLTSHSAHIAVDKHSKASSDIREQLNGSAKNFSTISYTGTPTVNVQKDKFSKCIHK